MDPTRNKGPFRGIPASGLCVVLGWPWLPLWETSEWQGGVEIGVRELILGGAGFERRSYSVWKGVWSVFIALGLCRWGGVWESPGVKKLGVLGVGASGPQVVLQDGRLCS